LNFETKVALVTGAGQSIAGSHLSGIGQAVALNLAKAGAYIFVNDWNADAAERTVKMIISQGGQAESVVADVSDENQIIATVDRIQAQHVRIDILVHCAAVQYPVSLFDLQADQWRRVLDHNLFGTFCVARAVAKVMKTQNADEDRSRGKIVLLTSIHDARPRVGKFDYDAAKAGVSQLTRELALALAPDHINVNAIAPGAICTPMNIILEQDGVDKEAIKKIPWGRMGQSDEVAKLAMFLLSDDADYITGSVIPIDGGRSLV